MPDPHQQDHDERQDDRMMVPTCPECQTDQHMTAVSRTDYVVYFRCANCGYTQSVRKPDWKP